MIEVNGMAHVILTVSQWEKAHAFYGELLPFLGLQKVYDGNNFLYHVGGRTAVGIQRCAEEHGRSASCEPGRPAPSLPAGALAARTSTGRRRSCAAWEPISTAARWRATGRRATTSSCSRIPTASGSK